MDIKQYTTLTIGLIVGVLLIVGVVAPVIANMSSDNGGSGETVTYRNDSGDLNFYYRSIGSIASDDSFTMFPVYDDLSVGTYPEGSETPTYWNPLQDIMLFEESVFMNKVYMGKNQSTHTAYFNYNNASQKGNTLNYYDGQFHIPLGSGTVVMTPIPDVAYFSWYEGDYVMSAPSDESGELPSKYVDRSSEIYLKGAGPQDEFKFCITGSADDPHCMIYDNQEYSVCDNVSFNIENDVLRSILITVQDVEYTIWVSYTMEEAESVIDWDSDIDGYSCIVPTTVTVSHGSGSGSSGLSPTLTTILSVIPLVLTVGLVIGAIGFLRMKN